MSEPTRTHREAVAALPDYLTMTDEARVRCVDCGQTGLRPIAHGEDCERGASPVDPDAVPWDTAPERVAEIAAALDLPERTGEAAARIAAGAEPQTSRAPGTLAAAAIYYTAVRHDEHVSQDCIADFADVSKPGLRGALNELRELVESGEPDERLRADGGYPWNVEIDVAGVTWTGPGMEGEAGAEVIRDMAADVDGVQDARVINQNAARTDGGRSVRTFRSASERPTVSYGPGDPATDRWVLAVSCEGGRVEIEVDEETMYDLWLEVKNVPWPTRDDDTGRLEREVVHLATDANEEMLRDALAVLRGER